MRLLCRSLQGRRGVPGALLHQPGPELSTEQTSKLLHHLYRMMDRPARPMATKHEEKDISHTDDVNQVYFKNHGDEKSLSEKFKGPVPINSRPSRSTLELKVGAYASGEPRLQEFSWSSCKPAKYRDDEFSVFKDKLGRKPKSSAPSAPPGFPASTSSPTKDSSVNASPIATPSSSKASSINKSPVATSSSAAAHKPTNPRGPAITDESTGSGSQSGLTCPLLQLHLHRIRAQSFRTTCSTTCLQLSPRASFPHHPPQAARCEPQETRNQ